MSIVTILQLYAFYWYGTVIFLAPGIISYRGFALFTAILAVAISIIQVQKKKKIPKAMIQIAIVFLILVVLFRITPLLYGSSNDSYYSYFLVLIAQTFPAAFVASLVSHDNEIQKKVKKYLPIVALIFFVMCILAVFTYGRYRGGGGFSTDFGLNYQNSSYLAAFVSNLLFYMLITRDSVYTQRFYQLKIVSIGTPIMIAIMLFSLLSTGGRGGLVTFFITNFFLLIITFKKYALSLKRIVTGTVVVALIIIVGIFIWRWALNANVSISGMNRIMSFFVSGDTAGRDSIYRRAIESFKESPIVGHGFGSVFYELGEYSHNILLDAMVETGLIGSAVLITLIIFMFKRGIRLIRTDFSQCIWMLFMLQGLSNSLFSSYYLAHIPLWFGVAFLYSYNLNYQHR